MLSPRLTNCPECSDISSLLKKIDCKLAELGNNLYNNISYMLNKPVPADDITQLIGYRRILMYKRINPSYVQDYSVAMIASKVIRLTVGCVSRCNTPEPCIEERCDITIVPNPTSTSSTTSTTTTLPICYCYTVSLTGGFGISGEYKACDGTSIMISLSWNGKDPFPPPVYICAQEGSIVIIVQPGSTYDLSGGTSICTIDEDCAPPTTTTTTTVNPCPNCVESPVTIGTQTWDKCNLNVTTYANGDPIPEVTDPTEWASLTTGAWCYYNNDPSNEPIYGKLYNWYAVVDPRGLSPLGKRIPTNAEFIDLVTFLGGTSVAGGKMKETGSCHWEEPNIDATNESGFTGLGAGFRLEDGTFGLIGNLGIWWSSSEFDEGLVGTLGLNDITGGAYISSGSKGIGRSIRCLVDNTTTTTTTLPPTTTTTTTTICLNCVEEPVVIGTQTWDKCNLNVTTYRNGDPIPEVTDPTAWNNLTTGAWCYYNNDPLNEPIYGKLYNWYAVTDPRGLAPVGKSIPTDGEWTVLTDFLGGESIAGGKMKETGLCHWNSPNTDATNSSGFTGLPGGTRNFLGTFFNIGNFGVWWSSSEYFATSAWFRYLNYNDGIVYRFNTDKRHGFSVRCLIGNAPP